MIAILTGDLIGSRKINSVSLWLEPLKEALRFFGKSPADWEIYRGDSFQLLIRNPEDALKAAIYLKAAIKSLKAMDVRIAIGIGDMEYKSKRISQCNGSAFVYSGDLLKELESGKRTMGILSSREDFNAEINIILDLALAIMNSWSPGAADVVKNQLEGDFDLQIDLAKVMGTSQVAVSKALKRAHFKEVMAFNTLYGIKIKNYFS